MKRSFWAVLLAVAVLGLAACRTSPVYNVDQSTVVSATSKAVDSAEVKKAIIVAGAGLGWQIRPVSDGHLLGTLFLRDHMAQVDIHYTPSSYSIRYKDSKNLKYDGTNIHSNYNGWVQRLQQTINAQLAAM